MKRRTWTAADIDALRRDYPDTPTRTLAERFGCSERAVYSQAKVHGISKSREYLDSPAACRLRRGDQVGTHTQFQQGMRPWNKGMKGMNCGGRSKETQFKPGDRTGRAAEIYQPIGTERITKDGYRQRKVNDDLPLQRRWKMVHRIVWEEHHGPVPKAHVIAFRNGDITDVSIGNLALLSRSELMARNTIHNLPRPLAEVCRIKGKLTRQINRREKSHQKQD